jgi:hypothetical protein
MPHRIDVAYENAPAALQKDGEQRDAIDHELLEPSTSELTPVPATFV